MSRIVFLDTETTGLDSDRHDVWEIGYIVRVPNNDGEGWTDFEYLYLVPPDLSTADPNGLRISKFYERIPEGQIEPHNDSKDKVWGGKPAIWDIAVSPVHTNYQWSDPYLVARKLAEDLDGAHIVGAVPDFDARFLTRWLRKHGQAFTAHYHLIDVEALAVGFLAGKAVAELPEQVNARTELVSLPWNSRAVAARLGVDQAPGEEHTALGDARMCRDVYDVIMGGGS